MAHIEDQELKLFMDPKFLLEGLDNVFCRLKCAALLNVAFRLVLKNVTNGSFWF